MLGKSRSGRIPLCTKISRCQFPKPVFLLVFVFVFFPFCARIWADVFLIGKTTIGRFSNKESARARICSGATRAGVFFYTEIADLCRLGFIYTEFAGRLRVRRMARIWMVATRLGFSVHRDRGLYLHRDCRCIGSCGTMISVFFSQKILILGS